MSLIFLAGLSLLAQTHPVAQIDSAIRDGIDRGAFPGAVVVVGTADTVLLMRGYGGLTWSAESGTPSPDSTLYDLASLTKVVVTTPAAMLLVDRGLLDLDEPVASYLPEFIGEGKDQISVRDLLAHTSGLRAFLPLNTLTETAAEAKTRVLQEELRFQPGSRVVYSDLNAILLGWVIEAVSGMPLDEFSSTELFEPLGMAETRYRLPRSLHSRAAPINVWRGTPIQGVVHDQNAERLGGVSGHAGLYSTGSDMARYAQTLLRLGRVSNGESLISQTTVIDFTSRGRDHRALGFEMRDTTVQSSAGELFSANSFGHGGFTGTSIWLDPDRGLFVVLLTNRVYAPRTSRSISVLREIRGRVADAAVRLNERTCRILAIAGSPVTGCP